LFLHNCDEVPSNEIVQGLAKRFSKVFLVNWIGNFENVYPIPIGLENRSFHTNGVPKDFRKLIRKGIPSIDQRRNQILVSFSVSTNPAQRRDAIHKVNQIKTPEVRTFNGGVGDYHREVLNSRFVLSPPGNGYDCHRTWEAIYLGAIPIVKRQFWPFEHMNLPVIIIDDWENLLNLDTYKIPNQVSVDFLRTTFLEM
jgi:hypothetical protein